jgi:Fe2+ transport system protein FeoA
MKLTELNQGQSARITAIGGEIRLRRRILEMGLTRGAEIHVEKYAPLKDPLELVVRGNHISLRVKEAAEITVELI